MKAIPAPTRRALLMACAVVLLLLPSLGSSVQPASAASTTSYPVLYDSGPTTNCHSTVVESPPDGDSNPPSQGNPDLTKGACAGEQSDPTFSEDSTHSAWDFGTYGWNDSNWGQWPGYNFLQTGGGNGTSTTLTMRNSATGGCDLHETNFSWTYTNMELRPDPDDQPLNMAEGGVGVSYNAQVQQNGGFTCTQHRALLTTDFILQNNATSGLGAGEPAVISIAHFDSGPMVPGSVAGDVIWNTLGDTTPCDSGCRVMVEGGVQIPNASSSTSTISDDFGQLFQQYKSYVDPANDPASDFILRGIQIVDSNEGSDTTASVSHVSATFTPSATVQGSISYEAAGTSTSTLCLDDNTQSPATADIQPCTKGDNAQNWTFGWDNTLQVNGLCLDAYQAGKTVGTKVDLYQCNGGQNQKFVIGRWNEIWNPVSGLCLSVGDHGATAGDSSLDLETCEGQGYQHWYTPGTP
jgi:hypothetical protein